MSMNPEIKTRWVAALRSGKYRQGTGKLRKFNTFVSEEQFCCLGVLCEMAIAEGIAARSEGPDAISTYVDRGNSTSREFLPSGVAQWAGFEYGHNSPVIPELGKSLVGLNDNGKTFEQIADIIEEHL